MGPSAVKSQMTFLMFARKLSFPNHNWAPTNSQVRSWLLLYGHPIKGHVCFFYLLWPTLNLRGDLVKTLLKGEWLSFSDIEWSCLIAESMKLYGILLKSLCRMVVQCMATWRFRINGRTRKFRQCSWIKFDFCCFICLFRQAQRNSMRYSLAL